MYYSMFTRTLFYLTSYNFIKLCCLVEFRPAYRTPKREPEGVNSSLNYTPQICEIYQFTT